MASKESLQSKTSRQVHLLTNFRHCPPTQLDLEPGIQFILSCIKSIPELVVFSRYGSADICRDHCMMIAHILQQGALNPTPQCCHLVELLRRLLRFMAPEHQVRAHRSGVCGFLYPGLGLLHSWMLSLSKLK